MRLRVGILGCANIAEKYAIAAFKSVPDLELVAIASRSPQTAAEWAAHHDLQPESYDSLLAREDIHLIYSPLPVGLQEEWCIRAMETGKHVIAEKSISFSLESVQRMLAAATNHGVLLYENFVPAFHPQHARIRELMASGAIGAVRTWTGYYGFPPFPATDIRNSAALKGGALNDCGCYTAFMARLILQEEPTAVTCALEMRDGRDERGSALFEFSRAVALMSFGFDAMYRNAYSVWGSAGIIETNRAFAIPPTLTPPVTMTTNNGSQELRVKIEVPAANQFALSFAFVAAAIAHGDFGVIHANILQQARVLEAMRRSARDGKRIELASL